MTDKKTIEVKIIRDGVYVDGNEVPKGVHSVPEKVGTKWLKRGIAILPGDDPEEKAKAAQAGELAKAKARIVELEAELAKAKTPAKAK